MKQLLVIFCFLFSTMLSAQSVLGVWENVDDEDGKPKSHIEISEEDGKLIGKVVRLLEGATLKVCTACKDERRNKNIEGMTILWDLKLDNDKKASGGRILDPKKGKEYGCKIELKEADVLEVRGYIGSPIFGRTQKWYRVTESYGSN